MTNLLKAIPTHALNRVNITLCMKYWNSNDIPLYQCIGVPYGTQTQMIINQIVNIISPHTGINYTINHVTHIMRFYLNTYIKCSHNVVSTMHYN